MTIRSSAFNIYRGDGVPPKGKKTISRDEAGAYIADPELVVAVNTALAVELPLLITGEPGTGKTTLAWSVASELGLDGVLAFHTRSDHQARDALYTFDQLRRLSDAQVGGVKEAQEYIALEAMGKAISSKDKRYVVLIDEIDKAPRDFPNDLLNVIEKREFRIPELGPTHILRAQVPHVIIITSNSERQLPPPFLRRCVFHHIGFPDDEERLRQILLQRLGPVKPSADLCRVAIRRFLELRGKDLQKRPGTSELLDWMRALLRAEIDPVSLEGPLSTLFAKGALVKTREDLEVLKKLSARGK